MKTKSLAFLMVFLGFTLSSVAQIKITTLNSDGTPNSNCLLSSDSTQIGITNKFGQIYIEDKLKGYSINVIDINSDWETKFILRSDTVITIEKIQQLDDIEIKPIDTKDLLKEIVEFNQEKLPKVLNLKGEIFFAEMYIIPKSKSNHQTDTLVEVFSCGTIVLDVFGKRQVLVKNSQKFTVGEIENKEYLEMIKPIMVSFKKFENSIANQLSFKSYEIKKIKKFNSHYFIDDNSKTLKFSKDFTAIGNYEGKNEYKIIWGKSDSLIKQSSSYLEMGSRSPDKGILSFPFGSKEVSNINTEYIGTSVIHELEEKLTFGEERLMFTNSNFGYFYIHEKVDDDVDQSGYRKIDSFENLYKETPVNKFPGEITPRIYPLKLPSAIFFH